MVKIEDHQIHFPYYGSYMGESTSKLYTKSGCYTNQKTNIDICEQGPSVVYVCM